MLGASPQFMFLSRAFDFILIAGSCAGLSAALSPGRQLAQATGIGNRVGAERSRGLILRQRQSVRA